MSAIHWPPFRRAGTFVLVVSACAASMAQEPNRSTIVVTGSREPMPREALAADVVVIDAATLRASPADSLADVLRREAGVLLSRTGGPGQVSNVLIRGGSASQTVVLVDGVRVGSATLGQTALETLPLAQIDRIEVLRGPGSTLHGADAVGGVVQVFTRRGQGAPRLEAAAAVGGYGAREASAALRGGSGALDYAGAVSGERSRGVSALRPGDAFGNFNPDDDGHRQGSAQLQIGWQPAPGQRVALLALRTDTRAQYDASEFLPPNYAQDNTPDFRNRTITEVGALEWRGPLVGLDAVLRASRSVDDSRAGANVVDRARSERELGSAQLSGSAASLGRWTLALESGRDEARSTSLGAPVRRRNDVAALALAGRAGAWGWQADLRHDRPSDHESVGTWRLGGTWRATPSWMLRALAGTTFRAPAFNELHFPGYGVPGLKPERGRSLEAAAVWRDRGREASVLLFDNRVRDLIGYESDRSQCPPDAAYDFGCASNVARARLRGATLAAGHAFGAWDVKAALDLLDAKDVDTGQRLPRRAPHQLRVAARWSAGSWNAGAELLHLAARPDGGATLQAETTLDLSARWQFAPRWQLTARLMNAGDARIEPVRDYQGLGRQAWIGLRYGGAP